MPPAVRRKPFAILAVIVLALGLAAAATAANGGLTPPKPQSPNAGGINDSYKLISWFTLGIFAIVEGALVVFLVRFRSRGRRRDVDGAQIHGSTRLELFWTVLPVIVLAVIGSYVFYKLPGIEDVPARAGDRLEVQVQGRQYYWMFTYPDGKVTIDRLKVPARKVVHLAVTSPGYDVIHSWWIPELGGKFDAIPGKVNHTWFRADRVGTYEGQCAELCGLQHAAMRAYVDVVPPAEYASFVAGGQPDLGKQEYTGVCAKCHRLAADSPPLVGPNLGGNPLLKDAKGLEQILRDGQGLMPAVGKGWSDAQMKALTDYAKGLSSGSQG